MNKPTKEGAAFLRQYLDLRPAHGHVEVHEDGYMVKVHNSQGRWVFSGELVKEWSGCPVLYSF